MSENIIDSVSTILQERCGTLTLVALENGNVIEVHNIAWGRDMGESFDHITTNISPSPAVPHTVDFFVTGAVLRMSDAASNAVLYQKSASEA